MPVPAFLHPYAKPAAEHFVTMVAGDGATVTDADGRTYLDALAGLWFCQVGHGRREIAEAVAAQMARLEVFHCFEQYTNEPADRLAEALASRAPMPDARVFLCGSGSEAVDSAIKLARLAMVLRGEPDRTVVLARDLAYHGVTYGGTTAQGLPLNREGFGPLLPDVDRIPLHDLGPVEAAFAERGDRIAAVLAEPVLGAGGVQPPEPGYLAALRDLCDRHGALLILDEVICGFGRIGGWWAAQHYGVRPDLVTFAKGVTSGYLPMGGVLVGPAVRAPLEADPATVLRHGHTYSGHPTCSAAALANLAIIEEEGLAARSHRIAEVLGAAFGELAAAGDVAAVRGTHGIWAIDAPDGVANLAVRDELLARGVLARPIGTATVAFCPPLVTTDEQLATIAEATGEAVRAATAASRQHVG